MPMPKTAPKELKEPGPLKRWLLEGHVREPDGKYDSEGTVHHTHPWWKVMCLTGVDYFSTLGYQPGIAALAAGALSPIATLILVLLTLFGALPMYKVVAEHSPHGDGSISMLEKLLSFWGGKLFVLALMGFAATGFIITITLSAADATAHLIENPLFHQYLEGRHVGVTFVLLGALGAVFLKGFKEAVGIAVVLVAVYITLNLIVVGVSFWHVAQDPTAVGNWKDALYKGHSNPAMMVVAAMLLFPRLALGLSGFETGVVVMPLVKGDPADDPEKPAVRIRNTKKLLTTSAVIMSVMLISSSLVTTLLIPEAEFREASGSQPAGEAYGRALAYLAHKLLGEGFGTVYDFSTIFILWFAGSSAMAGLLNIVPRYLPRYGMAPEWTKAVRPLVLIFSAICFLVTYIFKAGVENQAGAYATGVLGLMTSATVAVTLAVMRERRKWATLGFGIVTIIFIYTTFVNIFEQPEGLMIAGVFVLGIVAVSFLSRIWRMLEIRVEAIQLDDAALAMVSEAAENGKTVRIIPNRPEERNKGEYRRQAHEARADHQIPEKEQILFFEVYITDPSDFAGTLRVEGHEVGDYQVLRAFGTAVPNSLAAFLLHVREITGKRPHAYLNWTEGNPVAYLFRYLLLGQGETAPITREILRRVEPDKARRPMVHTA
jgi:hypothetical protein